VAATSQLSFVPDNLLIYLYCKKTGRNSSTTSTPWEDSIR